MIREFTPEEKKLIINTPITIECFDFDKDVIPYIKYEINRYIDLLEKYRQWTSKDNRVPQEHRELYFKWLIQMLPNSYKVVNLAGTPDLEKLTNGMIQRTC